MCARLSFQRLEKERREPEIGVGVEVSVSLWRNWEWLKFNIKSSLPQTSFSDPSLLLYRSVAWRG